MRIATSILGSVLAATTLLGSMSIAHAGDDKKGDELKPFDIDWKKVDLLPPVEDDSVALKMIKYWDMLPVMFAPGLKDFDKPVTFEAGDKCFSFTSETWIPSSVNIAGFGLALPVFSANCSWFVQASAGAGKMAARARAEVNHALVNSPFGGDSWLNAQHKISVTANATDASTAYSGSLVLFNDTVAEIADSATTRIAQGAGWWFTWEPEWSTSQKIFGQLLALHTKFMISGTIDLAASASLSRVNAWGKANLHSNAGMEASLNGDVLASSNVTFIDDTLVASAGVEPEYTKDAETKLSSKRVCVVMDVENKGVAVAGNPLSIDKPLKVQIIPTLPAFKLDAHPVNVRKCTDWKPFTWLP
jgi:hypothetical protein